MTGAPYSIAAGLNGRNNSACASPSASPGERGREITGSNSKLVVAAPGHGPPLSSVRGKTTLGSNSPPDCCPQCGAEAIRTGPYLICIFDGCNPTASTTRLATKPSVSNASFGSPVMVPTNHEGDAKCHNILAVAKQ